MAFHEYQGRGFICCKDVWTRSVFPGRNLNAHCILLVLFRNKEDKKSSVKDNREQTGGCQKGGERQEERNRQGRLRDANFQV